ncbi:uncharacterized protein F5891DRAFT_1181504 [Suillus fuscotomentosus]|uniref:Uncharacterized protein n=1 Tax=Suillus fuscotomentosus TaxID=1912939 RepID=A0AAD4EJ87_9AGAM|nr:uncharacterized protein F5891DRAFT_1181504 [Suillus fuscotomentosus]KAG1907210.1 hypothetical protein F5891DRAFT_1181504 [Suillus fuscotomentosus]
MSILPPFNSSATQVGIFELSNVLPSPRWLDFFIKLIPTEKLRTELYLLYFLLKGRVYIGNIWQIVGEWMLEAQREESLRNTAGGSMCPIPIPVMHNVTSFSATPRRIVEPAVAYSPAALAYSATVRNKCETWLRRQNTDPIFESNSPLNSSTLSAVEQFTYTPLEQQTLFSVKFNGPPFCLLSTWITTGVQETFDEARKVELTTQARLMASYLDIDGYHTHHHNAQSELIFLQAKLCRAQAEAEACALAIENAPASNYSDSGGLTLLQSLQGLETPSACKPLSSLASASVRNFRSSVEADLGLSARDITVVIVAVRSSQSARDYRQFSSPPRPTLPPLLPEEVRCYKEYMNAESTDDRSDSNVLW